MKPRTVRRLLPVLIPMVALAATGIVYIRLGCMPGTGCGNISELSAPIHRSAFQDFLSLWQVG